MPARVAQDGALDTIVFFDCDDTLYRNDWKTADKITASIGAYCADELGVDGDRAYALYKKWGTCLKGLLVEGLLPRDEVETYLEAVHDIDYSDVTPDPEMRAIVERCLSKDRRFVFTASTSQHATRCLDRVGVADCFAKIVDTRACDLETKHSEHAFTAAMRAARCDDPRRCVLIDDSVKNIKMAKALGWTTVLVGLETREGLPFSCDEADHHVAAVYDLPGALPELFA